MVVSASFHSSTKISCGLTVSTCGQIESLGVQLQWLWVDSLWTQGIIGTIVDSAEFADTGGAWDYCGQ